MCVLGGFEALARSSYNKLHMSRLKLCVVPEVDDRGISSDDDKLFAGNHENVCLHARAIKLSVELVALDA